MLANCKYTHKQVIQWMSFDYYAVLVVPIRTCAFIYNAHKYTWWVDSRQN